MASLAVVDGSNITVTSDAIFGAADRQTILDRAPLGVWPFYAPTIGSAVTNSVTFAITGGMDIAIVTQPGNPLVIGADVLGVARYLGHVDG
jgi:hypothetical protein